MGVGRTGLHINRSTYDMTGLVIGLLSLSIGTEPNKTMCSADIASQSRLVVQFISGRCVHDAKYLG